MKLLKNLACGARLAFFRPVSLACFQISATQTAALIAVDFALSIAIDVMRSGWLPEFSIWGLYYYAFSLLLFLFSAWLVSLGIRRGTAFAEYSVVALSALPFMGCYNLRSVQRRSIIFWTASCSRSRSSAAS